MRLQKEKNYFKAVKTFKRLKQKVQAAHRIGLSFEEIVKCKPFPSKPYEREYSEPFIKAAKTNNLKEIKKYMMLSKYIVYCYDWSNFTALHWAAKRGYIEIC